jgi:hypothetical protein
MTTILRRAPAVRWLTALAASWLATGCGTAKYDDITIETPCTIGPPTDGVTVVIIQPTARFRSVDIFDGRGQLVGQLRERSHTVVHVPEGPTVLYAALGNDAGTADRLEGTLVAGRVYYATVGPRPGGVALLALNPRSPDGRWSHKGEYLATTKGVQMDPRLVTRAVNELGDPTAILAAGDAYVAKLDAAALAEHSIQETDGY